MGTPSTLPKKRESQSVTGLLTSGFSAYSSSTITSLMNTSPPSPLIHSTLAEELHSSGKSGSHTLECQPYTCPANKPAHAPASYGGPPLAHPSYSSLASSMPG